MRVLPWISHFSNTQPDHSPQNFPLLGRVAYNPSQRPIQKPVKVVGSPASYVNPLIVALERKKPNSVHFEPD